MCGDCKWDGFGVEQSVIDSTVMMSGLNVCVSNEEIVSIQ